MPKAKKTVEAAKVTPEGLKVAAEAIAALKTTAKEAAKPAKKAPKVKKEPVTISPEITAKVEKEVAAILTAPVTATVEVPIKEEPAHFMMFIGESFYTKEDFIAEAGTQGVSKRLPSFRVPGDLKPGTSKVWLAAGGGRKGVAAKVFGYFIPDAIEFIAGEEGEKTYADVIAHIKTLEGSKIVKSIKGEAIRKCGVRKVGGTYLTAQTGAESPLHLTKEQDYTGNFFRGMLRLTPENAGALNEGKGMVAMVSESCMVCFNDLLTSKDSATRAARERRRMEKGESPKWLLRCPKCTEADRATKKAASHTVAPVAAKEVVASPTA